MRGGFGVLLLFLSFGWNSIFAAGEPANRLDISLADLRWQALPRAVRNVYIAPDGRIWYECSRRFSDSGDRGVAQTVAGLKQQIEREFSQAAPQVWDIEPLLFEPGGRVWFSLSRAGHSMLLGYDGKEWIERPILDKGESISGHCVTRGGLLEGRANRFAGGAAWFITFRGVLRFDGKQWSHQKLIDKQGKQDYYGNALDNMVWLAVSPDGQRAVAYADTTQLFWVCREGKWTQCKSQQQAENDGPFPPNSGRSFRGQRSDLRGLVLPDGEAAWYLMADDVLHPLSLELGNLIRRGIVALINGSVRRTRALERAGLDVRTAAVPCLRWMWLQFRLQFAGGLSEREAWPEIPWG